MINTVKIQSNGYLVNGNMSVPKADGNMDYEAVKEWLLTNTPEPEFTQADLDAQAIAAKWQAYSEYCNALTVTTQSNNKFAADPAGLRNIVFKRDSIADTTQVLWIEDWGSFTTDKVELQEVVNEASALMQAKILELFGA